MTTRFANTVSLVVEGIGSDTTKSKGIAWSFGPDPSHSDYEWVEGLTRPPASISSSIDPFTSSLSTSSFTFTIANHDAAAEAFLFQQIDSDTTLTADYTPGDATVSTADTSGGLASTVVYIGDEVILLATHAGAGVYNINATSYWGTPAQQHISGTRVYTSPQYLRYRNVQLVIFDRDTGTATVRWRGFIDAIQTDEEGKVIQVSCTELFATLRNARVNRGVSAPDDGQRWDTAKVWATGVGAGQIFGYLYGWSARVAKSADTTHYITMQVTGEDDALVSGLYQTGSITLSGAGYTHWGQPAMTELRKDDDDIEPAVRLTEVFLVDYEQDKDRAASAMRSSTRELDYPFHPLAIAMGFICSTYNASANSGPTSWDAWNGDWGLGIPADYIDSTTIGALIDATPGLRVERMLLGWDGEEVDIVDIIQTKLLRPFGLFLGLTEEGLLTAGRLKTLHIDDYATAKSSNSVTLLPRRLKWSSARLGTFNQITAMVGGTPWRDPKSVTLNGIDGTRGDSIRRAVFGDPRALEIDFSTQVPVDSSSYVWTLVSRAMIGHYALPTIGVRVEDSAINGLNLDHGAIVSIGDLGVQDAWILDTDGNRIAFTSDAAQYAGMVIGRKFDIAKRVYDIDLLLVSYRRGLFARWRAPSAEVTTGSSTKDIHVLTDTFSTTASSGEVDEGFFTVGDEVEIWTRDGTRFHAGVEVRTVTSITGGIITVGVAFSVLPASGTVVRIADRDSYSNTAIIAGFDPVYSYMGDSAGTVGGGNDDADVYAL